MGVREFLQLPDGVQFANKYVQQIITSWLGIAGDETDAQLCGVPLRQTSVKDADLFALDARNRVTPGNHIRATHSSGSPTLFTVLDDGAHFNSSPSGVFAVGMIMQWFGAAADCPSGWAICDGTNGTPDLRDRFVIGAGSTYALGAAAGNATVDVSHVHTGPSHAHAHAHDMSHHHAFAHDHSYDIDHNHAAVTSSQPSVTKSVTDDGSFQTDVADNNHTHSVDLPNHDVANRDTGAAQNTSWSMDNDAPGRADIDTETDADSTADGTGDTSSSGSAVLSVINPYCALYYIMRIAA